MRLRLARMLWALAHRIDRLGDRVGPQPEPVDVAEWLRDNAQPGDTLVVRFNPS